MSLPSMFFGLKFIKIDGLWNPCFHLQASQIPIQHILMNTTTQQVKAMESVREIIKSVNFSVESIVSYSPEYVSWTANKVCAVCYNFS